MWTLRHYAIECSTARQLFAVHPAKFDAGAQLRCLANSPPAHGVRAPDRHPGARTRGQAHFDSAGYVRVV